MDSLSLSDNTISERVVCPFYLEGRCRFNDQCWNLHPPELRPPHKERPAHQEKNDVKNNSKTRMRTAAEVINRINWDPALNPSDFLVVYLDRFTGLEALPLTEFTSMDAESAIPQHRIQQFCYKSVNHVIWEKQGRLDYVFNSTSQTTTLEEFIRNVDT